MNGTAPFFAALIVVAAGVPTPPDPDMLPGAGPAVREEVLLGSSVRAKFEPPAPAAPPAPPPLSGPGVRFPSLLPSSRAKLSPISAVRRAYPMSTVGHPVTTVPP